MLALVFALGAGLTSPLCAEGANPTPPAAPRVQCWDRRTPGAGVICAVGSGPWTLLRIRDGRSYGHGKRWTVDEELARPRRLSPSPPP